MRFLKYMQKLLEIFYKMKFLQKIVNYVSHNYETVVFNKVNGFISIQVNNLTYIY